jgi:hypothetical protein
MIDRGKESMETLGDETDERGTVSSTIKEHTSHYDHHSIVLVPYYFPISISISASALCVPVSNIGKHK